MSELISIIMPAYNAEKYIANSIESVIEQTYANWELIIIDDGSTDRTLKIATEYKNKDERIIVTNTRVNSGVAKARNIGYSISKGRFVAFLDSDDIWLNRKLAVQLDFILKKKCALVYSSYELIDEDGISLRKKVIAPKTTSYRSLLRGSRIGCLTVMIDKQLVTSFEMLSIGHEDYQTWLEVIKTYGDAKGEESILAQYRVFSKSLSANKRRAAIWQWEIYRKSEKLNLFLSSFYFICYALNAKYKYRKIED